MVREREKEKRNRTGIEKGGRGNGERSGKSKE